MRKIVTKNNKTSGKVYVPLDWVGTEVEVTKASENKIGDKQIEDLIEKVVDKTLDKLHENKFGTSIKPENKIFQNPQATNPLVESTINLDDLACRPNPDFCGRDGSAISNDICNLCPNPVCKYFYEKKNLCNKENKYVKCKGNLRACSIKQNVGKDI